MTEHVLWTTMLVMLDGEPRLWEAFKRQHPGLPPDWTFADFVAFAREEGFMDEWKRRDEAAIAAVQHP